MFKRKPSPADPQPEAEPEESALSRSAKTLIETQLARYPALVQLRAVWRQLQGERELLPYVVPLLVVVFVGTYRAERARVKDAKRAR